MIAFSLILTRYTQIHKFDHHRGPVVQVKVSQPSDVLVSASHDATVCLWSLENFTLLNLIQLVSPVIDIQISIDSVCVCVTCKIVWKVRMNKVNLIKFTLFINYILTHSHNTHSNYILFLGISTGVVWG